MKNIIAIIPARMGSTRFPGKPMACILGVPMIERIYNNVKECELLSDVYVATCDDEIKNHVESIGGKVIMTSNTHERCSDRCAEAMLKIEEQKGDLVDIVVMVQGDEPMISAEVIKDAIQPFLENTKTLITNVINPIMSIDEFKDPNEVKVVADKNMNALYFSREPIPSLAKWNSEVPMRKQLGIILFQRDYLLKFNEMEPTPLEEIESVDMMRLLENNEKVTLVFSSHIMKSVDTPEDLEEVSKLIKA